MNYYFYISDTRDFAECCRYCIEKGFLFKNNHSWFKGGETLENLIEKDKKEYHKYFDSFKYLRIEYGTKQRQADYGYYTNDGVNLGGIKEFKCIVDFLSSQGKEIVEHIKKQTSYQIKTDVFERVNQVFEKKY